MSYTFVELKTTLPGPSGQEKSSQPFHELTDPPIVEVRLRVYMLLLIYILIKSTVCEEKEVDV